MPEMNGQQLRERLEQIKPSLRTLFMSGYTSNTIAHAGVLEEGIHFIQKPFSANALLSRVRELLGEPETPCQD
jgi:FixJ family two-component response regulator